MSEHFGRYQVLMDRCREQGPVRTAVVYPCSREALVGAVEAARAGLISPILVGPKKTMEDIAAQENIKLADYPVDEA